ncbi:MAG: hypothetical protein SGI89_08465 [bacterium]|nr:hypothetical protein [bacterium]
MIIKIPVTKILITVCFGLLFSSCNDNPTKGNDIIYYLTNSVEGNIIDLPADGRILKVYMQNNVLVTNTVQPNSFMHIDLPEPPANFLVTAGQLYWSVTGITISNPSAKVNFIDVRVFDSSDALTGLLVKLNHDPDETTAYQQISVNVFYCDNNLDLQGRNLRITGRDTVATNYNAYFTRGWNLCTSRITQVRENYTEYEFFNGEINGAKWYFINAMDNNLISINKPTISHERTKLR